jgi:quercetin dioxygenase-like cupin family protein
MSTIKTAELHSVAKEEGQAVWAFGAQTLIKASAAQTGGAIGLIEQVGSVGVGSPYHVHHGEDEIFFVLEGELTFVSGNQQFTGTAGSYTFLPRGIPHGFKVTGGQPARFFVLTTPAGFEDFILGMSTPAPTTEPPDMDKLTTLAAKHQIEILGPLPI